MTELDEVVGELDKAVNRGDLEAVLGFYSDDAVMVVQPGQLARGKDELRVVFDRILASGVKAKQLRTHVLIAGDFGLFTSRWTLENGDAGGEGSAREFIATSVFRKSANGDWKLVIDNSFGPAVLSV